MRIATFGAVIVAMLLSACGSSGSASDDANVISAEPKLETDQATLDAALQCTPFEPPEQPPALLLHGTFTYGFAKSRSEGGAVGQACVSTCNSRWPAQHKK